MQVGRWYLNFGQSWVSRFMDVLRRTGYWIRTWHLIHSSLKWSFDLRGLSGLPSQTFRIYSWNPAWTYPLVLSGIPPTPITGCSPFCILANGSVAYKPDLPDFIKASSSRPSNHDKLLLHKPYHTRPELCTIPSAIYCMLFALTLLVLFI